MTNNYIPRNDADFDNWFRKLGCAWVLVTGIVWCRYKPIYTR